MKKLLVVLLTAIVCLPQVTLANLKVLRSDFREHPPFMYEQDGKPTGALVDILNLAAKQLGYQVVWRKSTMDRTLRDVKTGLVDIIPDIPDTLQAKGIVELLDPIGEQQHKTYFLVKEPSPIEVGRFVTLQRFKLGLIQGNSYFKELDKSTAIRKVFYRSLPALIKGFTDKKFHILAAAESEMVELESELKEKNIKFRYLNYQAKGIISHNYAFAKGSPHSVEKDAFNNVLKRLVESGEVKKYFSKYKVEIQQ